jgi:glycosyltransferase involved in cell wall biosynthesis
MTVKPARVRVLVITAGFPPDGAVGSLRTLRLLKHLARTGSDVQVLTISPETYRAGTVIDAELLSQVPEGVRVVRARAVRPIDWLGARLRRSPIQRSGAQAQPSNGAAERTRASAVSVAIRSLQRACSAVFTLPDREAGWILPAVARGWASVRAYGRPDVIYSSGPPYSAHVVAGCLATMIRRPWVADFRDPWARAPWRDDRFRFEKRAWSIFERWIVNHANAVVFVTEANRADFAGHYGETLARRFYVVPNGCDLADFNGLVPGPPSERFVLLHAGSLYGARDPSPLFRAVAAAVANGTIDAREFRIRLIGRIGVPGLDLGGLVRNLGIETLVEVVPHMPRRMVLQEMLNASALLVVQPITRVSVPAKLYEYLAAGRPILALAEPDGATAAVVAESGAGIVVSPADGAGIDRALAQLIGGTLRRPDIDRSLYDGALRAAELGALLQRFACNAQSEDARSPAVPISTEPS